MKIGKEWLTLTIGERMSALDLAASETAKKWAKRKEGQAV